MFNRFAICVLLAGVFFSAAAVAQRPPPAPSPSPKPGDRAYTEEAAEKYKAAAAKYDAVSADTKSSLDALHAAFDELYKARNDADSAIFAEADASDDVKRAQERVELAKSILDNQIKNTTHPDEEVLQQKKGKYEKAKKEYNRLWSAAYDRIKKAVAPDLPADVDTSVRHKALNAEAMRKAEADAWRRTFDDINEKRKKAEAEKKKAEAEKKAQPSPSPEPKKTSCAPGSGATGVINNLACQEQNSGAGH